MRKHSLLQVNSLGRNGSRDTRVVEAVRPIGGPAPSGGVDRVFDLHAGGKIAQTSRVPLRTQADLEQIYTPGVARVALAIRDEPARAWDLTSIGNSVGIFTNGSRVLGLGDIGVLASMPVMEGKAVIYQQFAGISATPILVDAREPSAFVEAVLSIAPTFGGIHLEDIRSPDCFIIEEELRRSLKKPVLHDDQHGTATVVLASVISACRATNLNLRTARVAQIGLGAAGSAIAQLLARYGVGEMLVHDVSGVAMARMLEHGMRLATLETAFKEADIVITTTGRANLIDPGWIRKGQVIFALSNPSPEIAPERALAAGAAFAADGRAINNALAFPGLFRGALAAKSCSIVPEMLMAAAEVIAALTPPGALVPNVLDRTVHAAVADAVARAAVGLGLAGTLRLAGNAASGANLGRGLQCG
jgi:malate dehydrogenase (oxaloacetate-decarboxylating)